MDLHITAEGVNLMFFPESGQERCIFQEHGKIYMRGDAIELVNAPHGAGIVANYKWRGKTIASVGPQAGYHLVTKVIPFSQGVQNDCSLTLSGIELRMGLDIR